MLFPSLGFAAFLLALVLGLALARSWRARKLWLLAASYAFYAAWNPPFVVLIWLSTAVDFVAARRLAASASLGGRRRWLMVSLGVNLGLLGYFKYAGFLAGSLAAWHPAFGAWAQDLGAVVLPVGISFYTFQTLSYTIDVYRGTLEPSESLLDFALFVTFFPQLVAGPIVRAADFLPQCRVARTPPAWWRPWGISLVVIGLFMKVVLADAICAPIADAVFSQPGRAGVASAWAGTVAFAGQIYYDFAGYSAIAIGLALALGFALPDNFRAPYAASSFSDFWRRWHISLSSWLRDYLYVSLGGNRQGAVTTYRNLMATMLLGGLWHGAAWRFVAWGALHGGYLALERLLGRSAPGGAAHRLLVLAGVLFAWVPFRAADLASAARIWGALGGGQGERFGVGELGRTNLLLLVALAAATLAWQQLTRERRLEELWARWPPGLRGLLLGTMALLVVTSFGGGDAFLYFQF